MDPPILLQCLPLRGEPEELHKLSSSGLSLVGCAGSRFGQIMVDGWLLGTQAALEQASDGAHEDDETPDSCHPSKQLRTIWLSLVENAALKWFQRPMLAAMRMSVPADRHANFYTHFGDSSGVRSQLKMDNRFLGYVCLVDKGMVRWHVHSNEEPKEGDVEALAALITRVNASRMKLKRKT